MCITHMAFNWCRLPESNWPPDDYKSTALPNELSRRRATLYHYFTRVRVGFLLFFVGEVGSGVGVSPLGRGKDIPCPFSFA